MFFKARARRDRKQQSGAASDYSDQSERVAKGDTFSIVSLVSIQVSIPNPPCYST